MDAMTSPLNTPARRVGHRLPWLLAALLPLLCSCRSLPSASPLAGSGPPAAVTEQAPPPAVTEQAPPPSSAIAAAPPTAQPAVRTAQPAAADPAQPVASAVPAAGSNPTVRPAVQEVVHEHDGGERPPGPVRAAYTQFDQVRGPWAAQADYQQPLTAPPRNRVRPAGWHAPRFAAPGTHAPGAGGPLVVAPHPGLPPQAYTGAHPGVGSPACCGGHGNCGHGPQGGPWRPPGLTPPWPEDEYLCDGGDRETQVRIGADWSVRGLDKEDTIAHFDTRDGRTVVEPSNCVCIYAPRFASVRRVDGLVQHQQSRLAANVGRPLEAITREERLNPTTVIQPLQPQRHLASVPLDIFREDTRGLTVDMAEVPVTAKEAFLPHEDFLLIRKGLFDNTEKPRLAQHTDAALAWTDIKAVQVVIDDVLATEAVGRNRLEEVKVYELEGKPRLRICKVASTSAARPGDLVEFTLRFDNVGDQVIGNVTVIDHLTTRLEYVDGSQTCTLDADFFPIDDNADSLVLRWEIKQPMKVGQGGLIRFKCRVR